MNRVKPWLRRIGLFCAVLQSAGTLPALNPAESVYQFNCQNWTRRNGLPADVITGFTQTKDGYIWFGTQKGMVRFDGQEYKLFNMGLPKGQSQEIRSLSRAKDGGMWVSVGRGGFGFYDGEKFTPIEDERWAATSTESTTVFESSDGAVWTGGDQGLGRWVKGKPRETFYNTNYQNRVLCFFEGSQGRVWMGSVERGLLYWQAGKLHTFPDESLKKENIFAVAEDAKGQIWAGTGNGLRCYDSKFQPKQIPAFYSEVNTILVDHYGVVWVGTPGAGLARYENGEFTWLRKTDGLVSDAITGLYEDSEGSLWVGTQNGLSQITDVKFPIYSVREGLPGPSVVSVSAARDGGLWITTDRGLAYCDGQKVRNFTNNASFPQGWMKRAFEASNGDLYLTDDAKQLVVVSHGKVVTTYTNWNWPTAMVEDAQGVIVAIADRIYRIRNGKMVPFAYADGTMPAYYWVFNLCVGRDGAIWVASNNGIFRLKNGIARQWSTAEGLSDNNVSFVFEDVDGAVWAGLAGGIARIKDNQLKNITPENGLADNNIYEIVPDDQGDFWMDSGAGILKARRQNLNDFADGKSDRIACTVFYGLESIKVTGHTKRESVACKTADGRIWFPNPQGVAMVEPAHLVTDSVVPPVRIQQIRINGIEVQDRKVPALPVGGGRMEFHFAALSYIAPQKATVRYQLEGFDNDWIDAEGRRSVLYNNLKPGKYSFRVQGCNADGVWNTAGDTFAVELPPAFHQTTWFLGLCVLTGLAGLGLVYRWLLYRAESKQRRLKAANDLLELKVRERTAELAEANVELDKEMQASRRADEALRAEQRLMRTMINALPMSIGCINKAGRFVFANNLASTLFGKPLSEIEGRLFSEVMSAEMYEKQKRLIDECLTGKVVPFVHEYTLANGGKVIGQGAFAPVAGQDGSFIGAVYGVVDITARKQLELKMEQTHQQLMVVSRQAGMAEVATGVLHNVGNVLNSVNVSANLVVDSVRTSRASSLAKVVELLNQHQTDLAEFLTRDEKGKQLHAFLGGLSDHLAAERAALLEELRSLTANIEHIKEIVAMQQANAHRFGVVETAQAAELMENALKMNEAAYNRHHVGLIREFEEVPPILVDKHKVLQILINLLQNAKRACSQSANQERQVTVRIRPNGEGAIRMEVADNGVGIPPENLTRIFAHGFTTQSDGHGFGLHNGALTAKQLGGTLTAHSEGPGKGATFVLELPLQNATSPGAGERRTPANGGSNPAPLPVLPTGLPPITLPPKRGALEEMPQGSGLN
jgi:PAS domain S-box-containing protein